MADFQGIAEALIKGQAPEVKELIQQAVSENSSPEDILTKGLIAGMSVVGKRFKKTRFMFLKFLSLLEPCMQAWIFSNHF